MHAANATCLFYTETNGFVFIYWWKCCLRKRRKACARCSRSFANAQRITSKIDSTPAKGGASSRSADRVRCR